MSLAYQSLFPESTYPKGNATHNQSDARFGHYRRYLEHAIATASLRSPILEWRPPKPEEKKKLIQQDSHEKSDGHWIILTPTDDFPEEQLEDFLSTDNFVTPLENTRDKEAHLKILAADEELNAILLKTEPTRRCWRNDAIEPGKEPRRRLRLVPNTYVLDCQRRAMNELTNFPKTWHRPLLQMATEVHLPACNPQKLPDQEWMILQGDNSGALRDGTDEQRRFVETALATDDFALLDGPPGSGKTTAISELILQAAKRGQRVLLAASTHVAVDNVLERLMAWQARAKTQLVSPIRIARNTGKCSPQTAGLTYARRCETYRKTLRAFLEKPTKGTPPGDLSRKLLSDALLDSENDEGMLDRLILDSANLICGTTIGLLQHPDIKRRDDGFRPFDLLILDEASKTTFTEFLVPATLAKKWVIVGDIRQLTPYVDAETLAGNLRPYLRKDIPIQRANEITDDLAWRIVRAHELRDGSASDRRKLETEIERLCAEGGIAPDRLHEVRTVALFSVLEILQRGSGSHPGWNYSALTHGLRREERKLISLRHQHRMHPDISAFPRKQFYSLSEDVDFTLLQDAAGMAERRDWGYPKYPSRAHRIQVHAMREHEHPNEEEVEHTGDELERFICWAQNHPRPDGHPWEVAILTFYRNQESALREGLRYWLKQPYARHDFHYPPTGEPRISIRLDTVDRFQGHEADLVFLSFRNTGGHTGFLNSPNRMNVAMTRARYQLVMIGDFKGFERGRDELLRAVATPHKNQPVADIVREVVP